MHMLSERAFSAQGMFEKKSSRLPPFSGCTSMNCVFVLRLPYECFAYIDCMVQTIRSWTSIADKLYDLYKLNR